MIIPKTKIIKYLIFLYKEETINIYIKYLLVTNWVIMYFFLFEIIIIFFTLKFLKCGLWI